MVVALVVLLVFLVPGPAGAFDYVGDADGTWWGIQDGSSPMVDTGSIRATQDGPWDNGDYTTLITGYGGVRLEVNTEPEPRMNGEMLRGYGLEFDGEDDFTTTQSVELGGIWASRSVHVETSADWGRWLDTFTNTTREPLTIRVAFGGQTGVGDADSTCSRCDPAPVVATSSGDTVVDPGDAWTTAAPATDGDDEVAGPIATVLGTPSTPAEPFDGAIDFAGTWLFDTFDNPLRYDGHEGNFPAYVSTMTVPPRESVSLLHYVVIGSEVTEATARAEQADVEATAAALAAAPDLSGLDATEVCTITNFDDDALAAGGFDLARCDVGHAKHSRVQQPRAPQPPKAVTTSDYDVVGATLGELRADLESGATTSVEITQAYLDRIEAYDTGQFGFNAYEIVADDALAQARAADRARARGETSPVLGIPIAIKNLFDTHDMATTNGSYTFDGFLPERDAFQVAQLREAGAVIIGKAALEEYATSGSYSNDAWGQVWNAFDPSKSPLASSGGSAVAVATNMAAAALGSQTGDSLYAPASAASLVTLRGTDGLQSSTGVMPLSYLYDYGGAMTQSVSDLADMLNVVAGTDPEDPVTAPADEHVPDDWRDVLDLDALEGKRIGFIPSAWEDPFGTTAVLDASRDALQYLEDGGATIVEMGSTVGGTDQPSLPGPPPSGDIRQEGWMRYIDAHPELQEQGFDIHNAIDVECSQVKVPYEREDPEDCWREPSPRLTDDQLQAHFDYRVASQEALAAWMDEADVDAVVYPGLLSDISLNDGGGNQRSFGRRDTPSARFGSPTVVVPAGLSANGEPVAIQLLGRAWDDPELVAMAYAYEQRANSAGDGHVLPDTVPPLPHVTDPGAAARGLGPR